MITFRIEKDGERMRAWCPELKGCHTFGETAQEAIKNLKNAVELYLEDELENQTFEDLISGKQKKHVAV